MKPDRDALLVVAVTVAEDADTLLVASLQGTGNRWLITMPSGGTTEQQWSEVMCMVVSDVSSTTPLPELPSPKLGSVLGSARSICI